MSDPGGPGAPITPLVIDSDDARRAAAGELAKPVYAHARPGLVSRFADWLGREFDRASEKLQTHSGAHGGLGLLVILLVLLVVVLVLIRVRYGPLRRAAAAKTGSLFDEASPLDAAGYRAAADEHAAAGRWAEAVRARLRAVIAGLEERTILTRRPGRTADVAARDAGAALPEQAAALAEAARIFDDIWYGERPATEADHRRLAEIDAAVASARPQYAAAAPAGGTFVEPR